MLLLIDNYDSFVYNLAQYFGELGAELLVLRNDDERLDFAKLAKNPIKRLCISPGPCAPKDAGRSCETIRHFAGKIPILGVCLGHQCIGEVFGGKVGRAPKVMHGKVDLVKHNGKDIFSELQNPMAATRYHSLIVEDGTVGEELEVIARAESDGVIMALRHKIHQIYGIQFHPESFASVDGKKLLSNFLQI